jgi:hypothetical protein
MNTDATLADRLLMLFGRCMRQMMPFPVKNARAKTQRACFPSVIAIMNTVRSAARRIPAGIVQAVPAAAAAIEQPAKIF